MEQVVSLSDCNLHVTQKILSKLFSTKIEFRCSQATSKCVSTPNLTNIKCLYFVSTLLTHTPWNCWRTKIWTMSMMIKWWKLLLDRLSSPTGISRWVRELLLKLLLLNNNSKQWNNCQTLLGLDFSTLEEKWKMIKL